MIIFYNGDFFKEGDCLIKATDRGFTIGDGVFDTLLAIDGTPQEAKRHFERLIEHAREFKIPLPMEGDLLPGFAVELLEQNKFTSGRYAIRTTLTRGPGTRGLRPPENPTPTLVMRANPVPQAPEKEVSVTIARTVRRNSQSPLSRIKSLNYGDNILALMEARERGFDDALLLNHKGNVTCATASNIFIEEQGQLLTPPLSDGVLNGITRALIMEKLDVLERSLTEEQVRNADAIYLTNSVMGVRAAQMPEALATSARGNGHDMLSAIKDAGYQGSGARPLAG